MVNVLNGSSMLGLGIAVVGGARVRPGPRGLLLATGCRCGLPAASAFTVGDVVLTRHPPRWWENRDRLLAHEERHAWQYAVTLGLPMLPLYAAAAGWSYLRGRDWWTHNVFEVRAGLADGGYPAPSRRERQLRPRLPQQRPARTA